MTTKDIAKKLVELCKQGKNEEVLNSLYSADAVSVEAGRPAGMSREAKGVTAIKAKGEWWMNNHEIHSASVRGPWPHDDRFVVGFTFDVTNKPSGKCITLDEVGLYTVHNGKIVKEEFFYDMGA